MPLLGPAADGLNATSVRQLSCGASTAPQSVDVLLKSPIQTSTSNMSTSRTPMLVSVTVRDELEEPTICSPKSSSDDAAETTGAGPTPRPCHKPPAIAIIPVDS